MSDDPVATVLDRLPTAKPQGDGWTAKCPAHEDVRASLTIGRGDDGRALLTCHAGCPFRAIVAALGLTIADCFPPKRSASSEEAAYDYRDEAGTLLFQVVRLTGKQFRQRRPDGNGGWSWKLNDVRRVLYRLPELAGHKRVLLPEGEKDVETLRRSGFPAATTNPGGAGKWRDEYAEQLKAAGCQRVAVLPDNDAVGLTHAREVARSCHAAGLFVTIVPLAGLPPKGDVSDFLRMHTREELRTAITAAAPFDPHQRITSPAAVELTTLSQLLAEPDELIPFLVADRIPVGGVVLLAGVPKAGKSTLARALTFAVATGKPFLGWTTHAGPCWYLALEEKRSEVRKAFRMLGATGAEPIRLLLQQATDGLLAELHELARQERPALIVVDTLQRLIRTKDLNDYAAVSVAFDPLLALARETGAALLPIHHASAHATREGLDAVLGSTALTASVDNVLVLQRTGGRRVLSSVQRIGPDLDPVVLTLDERTGRLSIAGSLVDIARTEIAAAILELLAAQAESVTETWIQQQIEGRRRDQIAALRDLLRRGEVSRTGAGKRGDSYRYSRVVSGSRDLSDSEKREPEISSASKGLKLDFSDSGFLVPIERTGNQKPESAVRTKPSSLPATTSSEEKPEDASTTAELDEDDDVLKF